jgi:hypothetical protein
LIFYTFVVLRHLTAFSESPGKTRSGIKVKQERALSDRDYGGETVARSKHLGFGLREVGGQVLEAAGRVRESELGLQADEKGFQ